MKHLLHTLLLSLLLPAAVHGQWTRLTQNYPTPLLLNDISVSGQHITAAGYRFDNFQNHIFQSHDGGATWDTLQPVYAGYVFLTTAFRNRDTGYVAGFSNIAIWMRTTDAGHHWQYYALDTVNRGVSDMVFLDSKRGFACGYGPTQFNSGHCYYTPDGGINWIDQNSSGPSPLDTLGIEYINFLDVQTGYGLSNFGQHRSIIKTMDTGKHWSLVYNHSTTINGIYFWNVNNGIMVDVLGHIYKTQNGGQTWTQKISPVSSELISVSFSGNTGFIVGVTGVILKSTDGGETWSRDASATSESLFRVKFFSGKAYAVGNGGTVLRWNSTVGVREQSEAYRINIYPNPSSDELYVTTLLQYPAKELKAELINEAGMLIARKNSKDGRISINTRTIPTGTYMIKVLADGQAYLQSVVVKH